ncbi:MAG: ABC transporter permease [Cyclobacteriaceae bacterium]|nr:ABC transporter permease [Cyclobacteriaceae bacterium]
MRTLRFILQKEFIQIFRNKTMLPIIFIMPMIQLLVLSFAVDYEIKNIKLYFIDQDQSQFSRLLYNQFNASDYFIIKGFSRNTNDAKEAIQQGTCDLALIIEQDFEQKLYRVGNADVQLIVNAIDGTKAGLSSSYATGIMRDFNKILIKQYGIRSNLALDPDYIQIETSYSFWYNPDLNYQAFMVPGILVVLVTMIGAFLSSMNIVREKELGTIEQINVTPIKKHHFIIGKTLPFWIIGMIEFGIGLVLAKIVFNIPMVGSLVTLFTFTGTYLLVVLGMGLLISTITETQQQAMFISWFFLVIFILLGGLFTAVENMPAWAQRITLFNPVSYFIEVNRMVLLKGAGFADITKHFIVMAIFIIIINTLAIFRYRKVS